MAAADQRRHVLRLARQRAIERRQRLARRALRASATIAERRRRRLELCGDAFSAARELALGVAQVVGLQVLPAAIDARRAAPAVRFGGTAGNDEVRMTRRGHDRRRRRAWRTHARAISSQHDDDAPAPAGCQARRALRAVPRHDVADDLRHQPARQSASRSTRSPALVVAVHAAVAVDPAEPLGLYRLMRDPARCARAADRARAAAATVSSSSSHPCAGRRRNQQRRRDRPRPARRRSSASSRSHLVVDLERAARRSRRLPRARGVTAATCRSRSGIRRVDHVQHQVGVGRLLERGAKRRHQRVRQAIDESDRVADSSSSRRSGSRTLPDQRIERDEQRVRGLGVRPSSAG